MATFEHISLQEECACKGNILLDNIILNVEKMFSLTSDFDNHPQRKETGRTR